MQVYQNIGIKFYERVDQPNKPIQKVAQGQTEGHVFDTLGPDYETLPRKDICTELVKRWVPENQILATLDKNISSNNNNNKLIQ